jgi:hypothetical protein
MVRHNTSGHWYDRPQYMGGVNLNSKEEKVKKAPKKKAAKKKKK